MKASGKTDNSQLGMRKPVVNPTEQRTRFLDLAVQLRKGTPLNDEQIEYFASGFERIGNGESSDAVFHLKRNPGQKIDNEEHRQKMSLVFVQIAHYIASPDGYPKGEGLSLIEAFEKVAPLARGLFGEDKNSEKYSPEYLSKVWNDPSYRHMRTTLRTPFDPDSPLQYLPTKS
jgi:hypothetical protein